MRVIVEIIDPFAYNEDHVSNPVEIEIIPGTTLSQLGARLNLLPELTNMGLVNREVKTADYVLQDGDYVAFFTSCEGCEGDIPVLLDASHDIDTRM